MSNFAKPAFDWFFFFPHSFASDWLIILPLIGCFVFALFAYPFKTFPLGTLPPS
jgi:hypothetical protein